MSHTSFYASAAELPREDILADYWTFLEQRNGSLDVKKGFVRRDAWLAKSESWDVRHEGHIDSGEFERNYRAYRHRPNMSAALLTLLAFVKVNATEAYGVEVATRMGTHTRSERSAMRADAPVEEDSLFQRLSTVVAEEETYHTKILLGATTQFGIPAPRSAWRPNLAIRLLVHAIVFSPKALYHPIILGGEVGGVFLFNWMLRRVGQLFKDEPGLKETLEQRLIEVMVDEIGHVTMNRMAVGPHGISVAKFVAGHTVRGLWGSVPEFKALGLPTAFRDEFDRFDWSSLPREVRRRGFFA